jgi:ribosome biogenesis GTP-binding protein YsxC/EngB
MKSTSQFGPPQLVATAYRPDQLIFPPGPKVLFLGRSNAGKSSLLNHLLKTSQARVSKQPGKTRSINYYRWGPRLILIDLPGFGYARRSHSERSLWEPLVRDFFDGALSGAMAFILMDSRRRLEDEEAELIASLHERNIEVRLLMTKWDRGNQSDREHALRRLESDIVGRSLENLLTCGIVSVKTGEGIEALRRIIVQYGQKTKT